MVELGADPTIVNYYDVSPLSLANTVEALPDVLRIRAAFRAAVAGVEQPK